MTALVSLTLLLAGCREKPEAAAKSYRAAREVWETVQGEDPARELSVSEIKKGGQWQLPSQWDNRKIGRTASIKNQGSLGTCWAFAALGGLEALWLPQNLESFSVDHLVMNQKAATAAEEGGNFTMVLAYLTGWKGPVWEADDPYADGITSTDAPVQGHLQEAQFLQDDSYAIKAAVLQNGAVQSSVHMDEALRRGDEDTEYYNAEKSAYYYDGTEGYNHDVLIIGWNDAYSRANFAKMPPGDGAFICQNSWGETFGEQGFFYVSYYDTAIAKNTLAFTRLDQPGVYDSIYQYDELGWTGLMGFEAEEAWGANVFTAQDSEALKAVSFYTVDDMTSYEIYVDLKPNPNREVDPFSERILVAQGNQQHAGYYTIDLEKELLLQKGQSFAVIVHIVTPGSSMPLAAEYGRDDKETVIVRPQESYISADGIVWEDSGRTLDCNVCIKAFTKAESCR